MKTIFLISQLKHTLAEKIQKYAAKGFIVQKRSCGCIPSLLNGTLDFILSQCVRGT